MLCFGLISSDLALIQALAEQMKDMDSEWQFASTESLASAMESWTETWPSLILWDCETAPANDQLATAFAQSLSRERPGPLLLTLGHAPNALDSFGVSEQFERPLRLGHFFSRLQFYRHVLKRPPDTPLTIGPWVFAPRARTLTPAQGGDAVKLTEKEADLLEYLCTTSAPVSREELLAALWGYDLTIDTHTLETHIYRLRRKLMAQTELSDDVFVSAQGGYSIAPSWRKQVEDNAL